MTCGGSASLRAAAQARGDEPHAVAVALRRVERERRGDHDQARARAGVRRDAERADAARDDEAQVAVVEAGALRRLAAERRDLGALGRELERDRPGRGLEAVEVLVQQERPAAVDADALEDAVAVEQAVVEHGDARLLGRRPLPIDVRDHDLTSERLDRI